MFLKYFYKKPITSSIKIYNNIYKKPLLLFINICLIFLKVVVIVNNNLINISSKYNLQNWFLCDYELLT